MVRLGFGKIIRQKPEEWIMISKLETKWPSEVAILILGLEMMRV